MPFSNSVSKIAKNLVELMNVLGGEFDQSSHTHVRRRRLVCKNTFKWMEERETVQ